MAKMCKNCGTITNDDAATNCGNCGAILDATPQQQPMDGGQGYQQPGYQQPVGGYQQPMGAQPGAIPPGYVPKSKMAAGLLGIFLGAWGVHNFYLGNTSRGVIQIVVTLVTCGIGSIWGLIEGIMILAGSINTDANGVPLKD